MAKEGLIANEQHERAKADYDITEAQLDAAKARLAQAEAQVGQTLKQRDSTSIRLAQQQAGLVRARDQFSKTTIRSTLDGIITNLPVNEGEIAIVGIQNQPGTTLMTIADMSIITAEVKVDETDIVNVKLGQQARIKVDALGDRMREGHITEIGNSALARSTSSSGGITSGPDRKPGFQGGRHARRSTAGVAARSFVHGYNSDRHAEQILTAPIQALTHRGVGCIACRLWWH